MYAVWCMGHGIESNDGRPVIGDMAQIEPRHGLWGLSGTEQKKNNNTHLPYNKRQKRLISGKINGEISHFSETKTNISPMRTANGLAYGPNSRSLFFCWL